MVSVIKAIGLQQPISNEEEKEVNIIRKVENLILYKWRMPNDLYDDKYFDPLQARPDSIR